MAAKKKKLDLKLLALIVGATLREEFIYTSEAQRELLLSEGLIEINNEITNEFDEVATRATAAGIAHMNQQTGELLPVDPEPVQSEPSEVEAQAEPIEEKASKPAKAANVGNKTVGEFVIENDVPMPKRHSLNRSSAYPFGELEIGQSFFVAKTDEMPEPAKSLASAVSRAVRHFSVDDPTGKTKTDPKTGEVTPLRVPTRKFTIRSVEGGARIWRVDLD